MQNLKKRNFIEQIICNEHFKNNPYALKTKKKKHSCTIIYGNVKINWTLREDG